MALPTLRRQRRPGVTRKCRDEWNRRGRADVAGFPCGWTEVRMSGLEHEHPVSPEGVAAARAGVLATGEAGRLAGLLGMLADPVRSRILFALSAAGELCVGDLALALEATEDQVSYALKMLRLAGVVSFRQDGRMVTIPASRSILSAVET